MVKPSEKNSILSKLRQHQLFKNRVGKFAMYVLIFVLFFDKCYSLLAELASDVELRE